MAVRRRDNESRIIKYVATKSKAVNRTSFALFGFLLLTVGALAGCAETPAGTDATPTEPTTSTDDGEDMAESYGSFADALAAPGATFAPAEESTLRVKLLEPHSTEQVADGMVEIIILFYDSATDTPVEDALISLEAKMPAMGHGTAGEVDPVHDKFGIYRGTTNFVMDGMWVLHLNPELADGTFLSFQVEVQVGMAGPTECADDHDMAEMDHDSMDHDSMDHDGMDHDDDMENMSEDEMHNSSHMDESSNDSMSDMSESSMAGECESHDHGDAALATDLFAPGETASLTFEKVGVYEFHCHPHPWMHHRVTVVEGSAPSDISVNLSDDGSATLENYFFDPANVTIVLGSTITYHNVGLQDHTVTLSSFAGDEGTEVHDEGMHDHETDEHSNTTMHEHSNDTSTTNNTNSSP